MDTFALMTETDKQPNTTQRKKAMKKQLEVGKTYPTRNGCYTGEVLCNDLRGIYPCCVKLTNIETGTKIIYTYTLDGRLDATCENNQDLIIPEPEPTYRAWNEDEIPVGGKIRGKGKDDRTMIILTTDEIIEGEIGFVLPNRADEFPYFISCKNALRDLEYHNGTSWQPCGVVE